MWWKICQSKLLEGLLHGVTPQNYLSYLTRIEEKIFSCHKYYMLYQIIFYIIHFSFKAFSCTILTYSKQEDYVNGHTTSSIILQHFHLEHTLRWTLQISKSERMKCHFSASRKTKWNEIQKCLRWTKNCGDSDLKKKCSHSPCSLLKAEHRAG